VPLTPSDTEEVVVTPIPTASLPEDESARVLVDVARNDLASRLGVAVDEIGLADFQYVVWPNAGLGCPQPEMAYTQVQVEGYLIRLHYGKRLFDYHGGGRREPFLCENPAPGGPPAPPPDDILVPPSGFNQ
jgi:hypothetical protein